MSGIDISATREWAAQASRLGHTEADYRSAFQKCALLNILPEWLDNQGRRHTRGNLYHPTAQERIERWHVSLTSRILIEKRFLTGDLGRAVARFVDHYSYRIIT